MATGPFLHRFRFGASQFGGDATFAAEFVPGTGPTNIYAPTFPPKPYIPPAVLPPHKLDDTTTTTYFVSDQIGIWDDRVQVFVGARKVQFDSNSYDGMTGLPTGGYKADVTTPAYALVVKPTSWLSLYANYVEALEPGFRVDPQSGAANAGELLPPGQSLQKEVGAKVDFGRIAATVSLFDIERPSIFRDPVTNIEGYNGRQRNKGLELNVFGEPIKGLRVLGGASFIDARLTKTEGGLTDGNRPSGVPEVIYVGHLDWDVPYVSGMAMRFGALHTGSVFADFDNTNRQPVEAWTRYDFGVRYDVKYPTHRVVYRLNVDNLFDKRYFQVERATLYSGVGRYYTLSATAYF